MDDPSTQYPSLARSLVGQRVGSYRVVETLGTGGMSTVFRAVHADTGHEVALKVMQGTLARNSTLLQRFLREARSAESLEHPHIVAIYDRGVDQGRHYLALEYVPGGDFHDYIQRNGPLRADEAVRVIRGAASALRYAASRGVIHRDIKPSNILRSPDGSPKIIDLGLALQAGVEDERVTREGTTVGTVDYMSPEQARDSRATSIQSDIYSLGCTFYYLLAGVPPYPGGDITDKLTRHARTPAPDIRDLRPDIPAAVARIVLRMMAKQPEERYADYNELIAALDAVPPSGSDPSPSVALEPLDEDVDVEWPRPASPARADRASGPRAWPGSDSDDDNLPFDSGPGLLLDPSDERDVPRRFAPAQPSAAPLPRHGHSESSVDEIGLLDEDDLELEPASETVLGRRVSQGVPWWLPASISAAVSAVVLVLLLHLTLSGSDGTNPTALEVPNPEADVHRPAIIASPEPRPDRSELVRQGGPRRPGDGGIRGSTRRSSIANHAWNEPADTDPVPGTRPLAAPELDEWRRRLPEWTRAAEPAKANPVVVRRVADVTDGPTEPTLHFALDEHQGGIVELADAGPLTVDDLKMSGESRIIRARPGYRPIIRIARTRTLASRDRTAYLPLKGKSLTLEGIDLIVDAPQLSGHQTALFGCEGSTLVVRDCTITVINPTGAPLVLSRQEPSARPSRIRLERTLVRGDFAAVAELTSGEVDLVVDSTAILGGIGPVVRVRGPTATPTQGPREPRPAIVERPREPVPDAQIGPRIFFAAALIASPGPIVQFDLPAPAPTPTPPEPSRRVAIRAWGSAFGRLQGPGIASLVCITTAGAGAERWVEWSGERNLYQGWKGFFAHGPDPMITVSNLAQARSTWNSTERESQEYLTPWPLSIPTAGAVPRDLDRYLRPDRNGLTIEPARPSPELFARAIDGFPDPVIPAPAAWALGHPAGTRSTGRPPGPVQGYDQSVAKQGGRLLNGGEGEPDGADLTLRMGDSRWGGDLGAFLRHSVRGKPRHLKVHVVGTGVHPFTPVRLPDGMVLEIRVDPTPGAGSPAWYPRPQVTASSLIELHGGALILANVILLPHPDARLDSVLLLDEAHLVLVHCRLTVPPGTTGAGCDLIRFLAPTTRPVAVPAGGSIFRIRVDRPVCRLIDTILIASRTALRADLARGLVALSNCAIASDETAIELNPAGPRVARGRFAADLWLEQTTVMAGHSIVALGRWPGLGTGPYRPWLLNSRRSAFLTFADARSSEAVLVRADADAFAGGCLFWQSDIDAFELDHIAAAGETLQPTSTSRPRDLAWIQFWTSNRHGTIAGPRSPVRRSRERPRPGSIEPVDLLVEATVRVEGKPITVGADLARLGVRPRDARIAAPRR